LPIPNNSIAPQPDRSIRESLKGCGQILPASAGTLTIHLDRKERKQWKREH